jgi:pyrimidine operon attenuation protein/uracil phosphoribosyltransferase
MTDARLQDVNTLLESIVQQLRDPGFSDILMVGIHTGGAWLADALHKALDLNEPLGTLDISFYRDDFHQIGLQPSVGPSDLPVALEGRHVVLVDDVIYTGRTIRAAMNELFDFGRPRKITLVALVERDGRELPVQPDIVGSSLRLADDEQVKLSGPAPLDLTILRKSE